MEETTMTHESHHDCVEYETLKRRTYRATGWDTVTHVEVHECTECGRHVAFETLWGEEIGDFFGYEPGCTLADVLADYDLTQGGN